MIVRLVAILLCLGVSAHAKVGLMSQGALSESAYIDGALSHLAGDKDSQLAELQSLRVRAHSAGLTRDVQKIDGRIGALMDAKGVSFYKTPRQEAVVAVPARHAAVAVADSDELAAYGQEVLANVTTLPEGAMTLAREAVSRLSHHQSEVIVGAHKKIAALLKADGKYRSNALAAYEDAAQKKSVDQSAALAEMSWHLFQFFLDDNSPAEQSGQPFEQARRIIEHQTFTQSAYETNAITIAQHLFDAPEILAYPGSGEDEVSMYAELMLFVGSFAVKKVHAAEVRYVELKRRDTTTRTDILGVVNEDTPVKSPKIDPSDLENDRVFEQKIVAYGSAVDAYLKAHESEDTEETRKVYAQKGRFDGLIAAFATIQQQLQVALAQQAGTLVERQTVAKIAKDGGLLGSSVTEDVFTSGSQTSISPQQPSFFSTVVRWTFYAVGALTLGAIGYGVLKEYMGKKDSEPSGVEKTIRENTPAPMLKFLDFLGGIGKQSVRFARDKSWISELPQDQPAVVASAKLTPTGPVGDSALPVAQSLLAARIGAQEGAELGEGKPTLTPAASEMSQDSSHQDDSFDE